MKITDTIHLVASGAAGFDLTHALDCNVFLMTDGCEHHIFDSGAGLDLDGLLGQMRFGGLDPAGLRTVFLTHGHADHSGGAAGLKAMYPHVRILSGPRTAAILEAKDERLISLDKARGGFYPLDYGWTAPDIDEVLVPGRTATFGALTVTLYETPGHSADHCCYRVVQDGNASLVAGDALFAGGRIFLQDIEDCSVSASLASIRLLAGLGYERFLPGHGAFALKDGSRHARAALAQIEAGRLPQQM